MDGFQPGSGGERLSVSHQHLKPFMKRNMILMLMLMVISFSIWDLSAVFFRYLVTRIYTLLFLSWSASLYSCSLFPLNTLVSRSRSVFLQMASGGWSLTDLIDLYSYRPGVSSAKPVYHLQSSRACIVPHCILCVDFLWLLLSCQVCSFPPYVTVVNTSFFTE